MKDFYLMKVNGSWVLRRFGTDRALFRFEDTPNGFFDVFSSVMTHADEMRSLTVSGEDGETIVKFGRGFIELWVEEPDRRTFTGR